MKEAFASKKFQAKSRALHVLIGEVIAEYEQQSLTLTLRQLFYQLVSRGHIPNNEKSYKNLGNTIKAARLCGIIDWDAIEDRTRSIEHNSHWSSPADILESAADSFHLNLWDGQNIVPEVYVEKEALVGVVAAICKPLDVAYFACHGNTSQISLYDAGKRYQEYISKGVTPIIFYLGDHDPSGMDMTRDVRDRVETFTREPVIVKRLALTKEQVIEYELLPNPAKTTDTRFDKYAAEHGESSWELDALPPAVLTDLIRTAIDKVRDIPLWESQKQRQEQYRNELLTIAKNYENTAS